MFDILKGVLGLLSRTERRRASMLLVLILMSGIFEVIGVASIMPFIAVVANPEVIHKNGLLLLLYSLVGVEDTDQFIIYLGALVFLAVAVNLLVKCVMHWAIARFANMRNFSISYRLFSSYLSKPYIFYLENHSADIGKSILAEVEKVVASCLLPAINLVAYGIIVIFLVLLIVIVNPSVALLSAFVLAVSYATIYFFLKSYLDRIGAVRYSANGERYRIVQETFTGIKEVKYFGLEGKILTAYASSAKKFSSVQASNQIVNQVPKFIMEALLVGGLIIILLTLLIGKSASLEDVLPMVALYGFAGQRLLPALQQVYAAVASLRFGRAALEALHSNNKLGSFDCQNKVLNSRLNNKKIEDRVSKATKPGRRFKSIELLNVCYRYPGSGSQALNNFCLRASAGSFVGLVGPSGSGKSTAIDILLGLLHPNLGDLVVDGSPVVEGDLSSWRSNVGYVPQRIFMLDDTIAANIAFGVNKESICRSSLINAAVAAGLHDFICSDLEYGYDTIVGEGGVRLSGGQRQRIGIARALYGNPAILVLDEATSALDNLTEASVMSNIRRYSKDMTIIAVAHRMTTVTECDRLYFIENGSVLAEGTFQELLESNQKFRILVGLE